MTARGAVAGERGAVVLWLLGLSVVLLFVGGLSLDLWRAFDERRALAGAADAAAAAGASGVDLDHLRTTGDVRLAPARAEALARAHLAAQPALPALRHAAVSATPAAVTVEVSSTIQLTLTKVLLDTAPLTVQVTATAEPARRS